MYFGSNVGWSQTEALLEFSQPFHYNEPKEMITYTKHTKAYYSKCQHNPGLRLKPKSRTVDESLIAHIGPWIEVLSSKKGPWEELRDPLYFRWYCFSQTLVVKHTGQEHHVKIDATRVMRCGGDKIWPLFFTIGLLFTIVLREEDPKYRWGSGSAIDPKIVIISHFNLKEVEEEMEDYNATTKFDKD